MQPEPDLVYRAYSAIYETRTLTRAGYARFRNFLLYGEQGLAGNKTLINIFQDVLTLEYGEHLLSRYSVEWQPDDRHLLRVGNPRLYDLAHLASMDALEVRLRLLGYYLRYFRRATPPEVIRAAATDDREAQQQFLRTSYPDNPSWQALLRHLLPKGPVETRDRLVELLRRWYDQVFHSQESELVPILLRDVEARRLLATTVPVERLIEVVTNGWEYVPEPGITLNSNLALSHAHFEVIQRTFLAHLQQRLPFSAKKTERSIDRCHSRLFFMGTLRPCQGTLWSSECFLQAS
jgi:hypothetical protein